MTEPLRCSGTPDTIRDITVEVTMEVMVMEDTVLVVVDMLTTLITIKFIPKSLLTKIDRIHLIII